METPKVNIERIKKYLLEGKRLDGRKFDEFRDLEIEFGVSEKAEGSARVKLGNTEVIAGVKMDVGTPYPDSLDKGNLIVSAELLPLSSSRYELGPPTIEAIELGRLTDRFIRESKFIQLDKLCIKEGEKVWNIFIDVYSINDDGNLLDAAGIAAIAALKQAKIPKYNEEDGKVDKEESSGKKLPLSKETPISITVYQIGEKFLVDPTKEEEDAAEARLTVGYADGIIDSMQKGNSKEITIETFDKMLDTVETSWKNLVKKIEKVLKE